MDKYALYAMLQAKPGKEEEVEKFLKWAQPIAAAEPGTNNWYALKVGKGQFGIFDTFPKAEGRDAHLSGEIAKALFARADELFSAPPKVESFEIITSKTA